MSSFSSFPSALVGALIFAVAGLAGPAHAASPARPAPAAEPTLLLREPSVSSQYLVFVYAGDIWRAERALRRQPGAADQPRGRRVRPALLARWPLDRLLGQL